MKTKNEVKHSPTPVKPDMTKPGIFPWTKEERAYIVRAVNSHEALLFALKDMSKTYHEVTNHNGYFHNCAVPWCVENRKIIAQAEGK